MLNVNSTGGLLNFQKNSGANTSYFSSVAPTVSNGQALWLRVTWDQTNGSVSTATFYTAPDSESVPSSWTQLGAAQTDPDVTGIADTTAQLELGGSTLSDLGLAGTLYRVIIKNGIDGTTVFDADFGGKKGKWSFTESSSNAATVDVVRGTVDVSFDRVDGSGAIVTETGQTVVIRNAPYTITWGQLLSGSYVPGTIRLKGAVQQFTLLIPTVPVTHPGVVSDGVPNPWLRLSGGLGASSNPTIPRLDFRGVPYVASHITTNNGTFRYIILDNVPSISHTTAGAMFPLNLYPWVVVDPSERDIGTDGVSSGNTNVRFYSTYPQVTIT